IATTTMVTESAIINFVDRERLIIRSNPEKYVCVYARCGRACFVWSHLMTMSAINALGYGGRFLRTVEQILVDPHITFRVALNGQALSIAVTDRRSRRTRHGNHCAEQHS